MSVTIFGDIEILVTKKVAEIVESTIVSTKVSFFEVPKNQTWFIDLDILNLKINRSIELDKLQRLSVL